MEPVPSARVAEILSSFPHLVENSKNFYKHLGLAEDNYLKLRELYRFSHYKLMNAILEQWVHEKGSGATVEAILNALQMSNNIFVKNWITKRFSNSAVLVPTGYDAARKLDDGRVGNGNYLPARQYTSYTGEEEPMDIDKNYI